MENKKTEKPEEKILRQEEFRVDCPRRIVVGDPSYFEEFSGERLKRLTANYAPPRFFEARVLLTEVEFAEFPGEKVCGLSVYMAPKETIETYAEGMMYEGQEVSTKEIGVDTAQYLMIVDGQSDTIHTGGDGYWGRCEEYGRKIGNKKYVDAIAVHLSMPEFDSYETVKQRMQYFFSNIQPVEKQEKNTSKKKTPER